MTAAGQPERANPQPIANRLVRHISAPRLTPYLACTATPDAALQLYRWNMRMAGELHQALALVEVVLRNALDAQLQSWNVAQPPRREHDGTITTYSAEWVKTPAGPLWGILNRRRGGRLLTTYDSALQRAREAAAGRDSTHPRAHAPVTHDDVVAHITFGTWAKLLPKIDPTHDPSLWQSQLWTATVHNAFPRHHHAPLVIRYWVDRLHLLRNRVAHLEPLLGTDVMSYHRTVARLLNAIDPDTASWYAGTTSVPAALRARP